MDQDFAPDQEVVVTEKLDGENTSIYMDGKIHARSIDSKDHESRHFVKGLAASLVAQMPMAKPSLVLLGENVFAKHSIHYTSLSSWYYLFGARLDNLMLPWSEVERLAKDLGLPTVPVIWRGQWKDFNHNEIWPRSSFFGKEAEGYVVRNSNGFLVSEFSANMAKFVRTDHVQTDEHWLRQRIIVNGLI